MTKRLLAGLVRQQMTIVSGLARGIEVAHKQALESGGRTIAVLRGSIDTIYPAEHQRLADRIMKQGAVISVFSGQDSECLQSATGMFLGYLWGYW